MRIIRLQQKLETVEAPEPYDDRELLRALRDAVIAENEAVKQYESVADAAQNEKVKDLQIGEILESKSLTAESDLQDVLIVAMKREEATGAFYSQMVELTPAGPARDLFGLLAKEEVKHKKYVESLYEEVVYRDF